MELDPLLIIGLVLFLSFVVFRHDNILRRASSLDNDSWFEKLLEVWRCCNVRRGLCSLSHDSITASSVSFFWGSSLPFFDFCLILVRLWLSSSTNAVNETKMYQYVYVCIFFMKVIDNDNTKCNVISYRMDHITTISLSW